MEKKSVHYTKTPGPESDFVLLIYYEQLICKVNTYCTTL